MAVHKVVVDHISDETNLEELAVMLESHIGETTVLEKHQNTVFSPDRTCITLVLSSQDAVYQALELHTFSCRDEIFAVKPWTTDWDKREPFITTSYSKYTAASRALKDYSLVDPSDSFPIPDNLFVIDESILSRQSPAFVVGEGEDLESKIPLTTEKVEFVYNLIKDDAKSENVTISQESDGINIKGPNIQDFRDHVLTVATNVDSQTLADFSAPAAQMIIQHHELKANIAFNSKGIKAALALKEDTLILLGSSPEDLVSARAVFYKLFVKQSFTVSEESLVEAKKGEWKSKLAKYLNPPRIHVSINENDGGSHIAVEGLIDEVTDAVHILGDWLKENATMTTKLSFSKPVWRLLKEKITESLVDILPKGHHLTQPKLEFTEEVDRKEYQAVLTGPVDAVNILSKELSDDAKNHVKSASIEIAKPGIRLSLFTQQPGRGRLDLIESENKCIINVRHGKTIPPKEEKYADLTGIVAQGSAFEEEPPKEYIARRTRKNPAPSPPETAPKKQEINVETGDLSKTNADILVCTVIANAKKLERGGALAKAFLSAGGDGLEEGFAEICAGNNGHLPMGEANISAKVGNLPCKNIIYLALCHWKHGNLTTLESLVDKLITKCLDRAKEVNAATIAFPTIGCGAIKFPADLVVRSFQRVVQGWTSLHASYNLAVSIVSFEDQLASDFIAAMRGPAASGKVGKSKSKRAENWGDLRPRKGITLRTIIFEIFAIHQNKLDAAKQMLESILPSLLNEVVVAHAGLSQLTQEERTELENIQVDGANLEINGGILLTGDFEAVKQLKKKVDDFLKSFDARINDPDYIKKYKGDDEYLIALSKEKKKTPKHWHDGKTKALVKAMVGIDGIHEVDTKTKFAVEKLVLDSWKAELAGGKGADAKGLTHTKIKVLDVWQNENRELFAKYRQYFNDACFKIGKGHMRKVDISGLHGEEDVLTSKLNIPVLDSYRVPEINEFYLFHGTTNNAKDIIAKNGLDFRVAGRGLFGKGAYFAESSTKADQYSDRGARHDQEHYMLLCRVILADPYVAWNKLPDYGRPPCVRAGACDINAGCKEMRCQHDLHDSVIGVGPDGKGGRRLLFREFVVYEKAQCYPEFIIKYERVA